MPMQCHAIPLLSLDAAGQSRKMFTAARKYWESTLQAPSGGLSASRASMPCSASMCRPDVPAYRRTTIVTHAERWWSVRVVANNPAERPTGIKWDAEWKRRDPVLADLSPAADAKPAYSLQRSRDSAATPLAMPPPDRSRRHVNLSLWNNDGLHTRFLEAIVELQSQGKRATQKPVWEAMQRRGVSSNAGSGAATTQVKGHLQVYKQALAAGGLPPQDCTTTELEVRANSVHLTAITASLSLPLEQVTSVHSPWYLLTN